MEEIRTKNLTIEGAGKELYDFAVRQTENLLADKERCRDIGIEEDPRSSFYVDILIAFTFCVTEAVKRSKIDSGYHKPIIDSIYKELFKSLINENNRNLGDIQDIKGFVEDRNKEYENIMKQNKESWQIPLATYMIRDIIGEPPIDEEQALSMSVEINNLVYLSPEIFNKIEIKEMAKV